MGATVRRWDDIKTLVNVYDRRQQQQQLWVDSTMKEKNEICVNDMGGSHVLLSTRLNNNIKLVLTVEAMMHTYDYHLCYASSDENEAPKSQFVLPLDLLLPLTRITLKRRILFLFVFILHYLYCNKLVFAIYYGTGIFRRKAHQKQQHRELCDCQNGFWLHRWL